MANPIIINSNNVSQFGVQTDFYPMDKQFRFNLDPLTTFEPGGEAAVQGVSFSIIDPSGTPLHTPNWTAPDIDPAVSKEFIFDLTTSFALYGWWLITATLKDQDGTEHSIDIKKNVCKPDNIDPMTGMIPAEFIITPNCDEPSITVGNITNLAYSNLTPAYTLTDGNLYYPQGTLDPIPFSYTPFKVSGKGKVYTGTYTVRSKTEAIYDLGDYFYVHLNYAASLEKKVTCTLDVCRLLCCLDDLNKKAAANCNNATGRALKEKLASITIPLMTAVIKDKCGQSASLEVQEIYDTLGCDCQCEGELAEPRAIGGSVEVYDIVGKCATTVTPKASGGGTVYEVTTKAVSVSKSPTDTAWSITPQVSDCGIVYLLAFDYVQLSTTILNTIKGNQQLTALFNSIVSISLGFDFTSVDGKCIIDTKKADYTLLEKITGVEIITGIVIDSQLFLAPANLNINNQFAISTWLNSLGKGAFNVYYDAVGNSTLISSTQNTAQVATLNVTINGAATARAFIKVGVNIQQLVQAIISYICSISTAQVQLGAAQSVCFIASNGTLQTTSFAATAKLSDYLAAQSAAQCALVNQLLQVGGIDCAKMKQLFPKSSAEFLDTDYFLGVKDGKCAQIEHMVAAKKILTDITTDATLYQQFCTAVNSCNKPTCLPVSNVTVTLDDGVTCVQVTDIEASVEE